MLWLSRDSVTFFGIYVIVLLMYRTLINHVYCLIKLDNDLYHHEILAHAASVVVQCLQLVQSVMNAIKVMLKPGFH